MKSRRGQLAVIFATLVLCSVLLVFGVFNRSNQGHASPAATPSQASSVSDISMLDSTQPDDTPSTEAAPVETEPAPASSTPVTATIPVMAGEMMEFAEEFAVQYFTYEDGDTPEAWVDRLRPYAIENVAPRLRSESVVFEDFDQGVSVLGETSHSEQATGPVTETSANLTIWVNQTQYVDGAATTTVALPIYLDLLSIEGEWFVSDYEFHPGQGA